MVRQLMKSTLGQTTSQRAKRRWLFGIFFVVLVSGCAQQETMHSPVLKPNAANLGSAGIFRSVLIEDMDNDGHPDVIGGASRPGVISISYGNGRDQVSEAQILPVKGDVRSVAVADLNEDGLPDIIFAVQKETSGIRIWLNQTKRQWQLVDGPTETNAYQSIKTADLNNDGHIDIVAANSSADLQGGIQVWLGDGLGNWHTEAGPTINGLFMDVAVADLNNDGWQDLIGASWGNSGELRVWLGRSGVSWTSLAPLDRGSFYAVSIGDLNNDRHADILAGSYRAGVKIFLGDGEGGFKPTRSPAIYLKRRARVQPESAEMSVAELSAAVEGSFWKALPVDLNNDGLTDILASSLDAGGIQAWLNKGEGRWTILKDRFPTSGTYYDLATADLNADGWSDVLATSAGEGIQLWPGKPGTTIAGKRQDIAQLSNADRLAAMETPLENEVYAVVEGIPEYKIGPGDLLEITLWQGDGPEKEDILVRQNGRISFGFVEDLQVKGLTASQLDTLLTKRTAEFIRKPRIDVVVKEYNSKSVTLVGAVTYMGSKGGTGPGKYALKGKKTVLELLTEAGGPTENANLRSVKLRRRSGQIISLNLYKTILQGDMTQNPVLDDGDLVFLPTLNQDANRVYVFGEVEKPGTFTFAETEVRLLDVIAEAGGATINAAEYETRVVRGDPTSPKIIETNLRALIEDGDISQNVLLASGDMIYVPRSGIGNVNRFVEQIFPSLRALATATSLVLNFDDINAIID